MISIRRWRLPERPPLNRRSRENRRAATCLALGGSLFAAGAAAAFAAPAPAKAPEAVPASWALRPLRRAAPPSPRGASWVRTPVDAFILQRLERSSLAPAPPAQRLQLLRRVTFDLLGLPPSAEAIRKFDADRRPDAYPRLVESLLASPQYGERWGRHWLDVVRYADSGGFETDELFRGAWQYRDYVIRSFNAGKPFDRFIEEQVAGDERWPGDPEAATATGLYCVGPMSKDSALTGTQLENEWLTDAADTTGAALLGLTMGCARCHDHKYDPLTQKDYYAFQAIFAASDRPYPEIVRVARVKGLNGLLSDAPVPKELLADPRCTLRTEDSVGGFRLYHRAEPLAVRRLARGELSKPLEAVAPGVPAVLRRVPGAEEVTTAPPGKRRAALARWLTSPENPLVARVLVNRVWDWHFGQALVRTPNDFGAMGERPTHPELLDFLARDLIEHGWDLRRLHRLILLSNTYQQSSSPPVRKGSPPASDPQNRLLWRYPRHRLEGEALRDNMLACAGSLNLAQFGPPVVPPLDQEELQGLFDARNKWPVTKEREQHARRSVYLLARRSYAYPLFGVFDPPDVMNSCPRRQQTVVPTQALAMLNSPLARELSRAFAARLLREEGNDPSKGVAAAWLLAFGRPVTDAERERAIAFLRPRSPSDPAGALYEPTLAALCLALFNANEFAYVD